VTSKNFQCIINMASGAIYINHDERLREERKTNLVEHIYEKALYTSKKICCLPRNFQYLQAHESTCCNHPGSLSPRAPCTCFFVLPVGGIVGLLAGIAGWQHFNDGIEEVDYHMRKIGVHLSILGDVLGWLSFMEVIILASKFIVRSSHAFL